MAYPNTIDSFPDPTPSSARDNPSLSGVADSLIASVIAIETELGTNPSGAFATVKAFLDDLAGRIVPTGAVIPYGGTTAPTGFLLCNGQTVSRATYADLFAVVAERYGAGDGSTTFGVPNMQDRFPLGVRDMAAPDVAPRKLGDAAGSLGHTHGSGGGHTHPAFTAGSGNHNHSVGGNTQEGTRGSGDSATPAQPHDHGVTSTAAQHTHDVSLSTDGAHTHDAADPPYMAVNFIIKT